jgi:signal peptidase I
MKRRLVRFAVALAMVGLLLGLTAKFVVAPFLVVGDSMEPTLRSLDLCLMQRVRHYQPARGDIVMFRTADDPPLYFVKRVVALPGETIAIEGGSVKINGELLYEPYAPPNPGLDMSPTNVPPGKVYVIGDNRYGSLSTLVATRLVTGRLIWHWRWKPERKSP